MRRPVIQLNTGVLTAPRKPQHVVFAIVHFVLELADWLTRQTHIVNDVQRPVNLCSVITTALASLVSHCKPVADPRGNLAIAYTVVN